MLPYQMKYPPRIARRFLACGLSMMCLVHSVSANSAQPQAATQPQTDSPDRGPQHLRVVEEKGKTISLQVASRDFKRADGGGPTIGLVGVAHIGDKSFYRGIQKLLDDYDVVLFESVKPPGTGGARDGTDLERVESTNAALQFVGSIIEAHHSKTNQYPTDLNALRKFVAQKDPRLARFVESALIDAWGHELIYEVKPRTVDGGNIENGNINEPSRAGTYSLVSLGADGQPTGEGVNADLILTEQSNAPALDQEDQLQSQLADVLGLEFQLEALSYEKPNWRCSDIAMDELNRRLQAKGLDFNIVGGTLAGTSLPAMIIKFMLGLVRVADAFMGGAIADTIKVVMIEMLGDERLMHQSLDQLGAGFSEVIVDDRNQIVIDDLKAIVAQEPQIKSVAVLYGAAHMPDMEQRLCEQLGYVAAGDHHWLTAISVDLTRSSISPTEIDRIRATIKRMMRQQMRGLNR